MLENTGITSPKIQVESMNLQKLNDLARGMGVSSLSCGRNQYAA